MEWTGGCLCGSIRYRAGAAPIWASYCHCGMCRRVSGAPFTGFVQFREETVEWTQGQLAAYQSSEGIVRRFCSACGTSLTFETDGILFISLGSLDAPEQVEFDCHAYTSTRLPGMELADGLPHYPGPVGGKGGREL